MKRNTLLLATSITLLSSLNAHADEQDNTTTNTSDKPLVVKVTADFREQSIDEAAESTTIIGAKNIQNNSSDHLEQILIQAPNVNFSSGASRGRFFQIRGIGERSQFIDPINPSVGISLDGIDLTGLGGAATLFDIEQVEVLRGPQGTRFGANALAGHINLSSRAPTQSLSGNLHAKAGNFNTYGAGVAISDGLSDNVRARIALHQFKSDGYMNNLHLNRKDTNNFDEGTARARLDIDLNEQSSLGFTLLKIKTNNGYDAFSLDLNRDTYSGEPGKDSQDTNAAAITLKTQLTGGTQYEATLTGSETDSEYGYDEDWAFTGFHPGGYTSTDQYLRTDKRASADIRLLSAPNQPAFGNTDWVIGAYAMKKDQTLDRNYTTTSKNLDSTLNNQSIALYGELTTALTDHTRLIYGARAEQWASEYADTKNVKGDYDEVLGGGKITLESELNKNNLSYITAARGYKAGGINSDADVTQERRVYKTEINNTLELGLKSQLLNKRLKTRLALFYVQRLDQQVKSSFAKPSGGGATSFQDFISNAAEGRNYGLEFEGDWAMSRSIDWEWGLGYLNTEFTDYSYKTGTLPNTTTVSKTGRAQAHAPNYTASTALSYRFLPHWSVRVGIDAKDKFFFSDSHDEESKPYVLSNLRLSYTNRGLDVSLYGRNLGNVDYETRGFGGFGNDPRNGYANGRYTQFGEPRLFGAEVNYRF